MHNYYFNNSKQQIILLIFFVFECLCQKQRPGQLPIEVSKCNEYEEKIFEAAKTFSFFMIGAPEISIKENTCDKFRPFIVEGDPAAPKEFPHAARLGISTPNEPTNWVCGGALISERFILTAAHCFYSSGIINVVRLGDLDFSTTNDDAEVEDIPVKNIIEHPDYNAKSHYNDIALIELVRDVKINGYKHPACLPVNNGDNIKSAVVAIGWGSERFASENSKKLLKVELERYSYDYCQNFANKVELEELEFGIKDESQLCAGSQTTNKDACNGDSGGPLLAYHEKYPCMYTIVGVTSFGIDGGCGNPGAPGVYTRVYNYMDWIKQHIWS